MSGRPVPTSWRVRDATIRLGRRPLVMGILNVTPDSFFDGGIHRDERAAVDHARSMVAHGADLIDVGGESTRPGSDPVGSDVEARRVGPGVRALSKLIDVPISIDTRKADVAASALDAGAQIVNDVSGLSDPRMLPAVMDGGAGLVLMHMKGAPKSMQAAPSYEDVVAEVRDRLVHLARTAEAAGAPRDSIVVDPGIGFGKRTGAGIEDNLSLLRHVDRIREAGYPILLGASRKSFIGNVLSLPVEDRLEGSLAAAALGVFLGVDVVRVHDVAATRRAVDLAAAIRDA